MKAQPEIEFLETLGIHIDEYGTGKWRNREVRYLKQYGLFQIGDNNFDRWANSVEWEFYIWQPKEQRALERFVENNHE